MSTNPAATSASDTKKSKTPSSTTKRDLIDTAKQNLERPLLLYFSEADGADARSDTRSETGSEGGMEEFTREMEETAVESYERESTRQKLQRASLSRGFEKSRMELSRISAEEENDDGSNALVNTLRRKVCDMDEQCDKLDREKTVLADLLNSKKRDFDQMKQHYKKHIVDLEEENSRLKSEKSRLVDKLKLPESERSSLAQQENDLAAMKRRFDDAEARCAT